MERQYTNTECQLYGTKYCKKINMLSCETCTLSKRDKQELQRLKDDLDTLDTLMPEGGIHELFTGDKCVLCKGTEKGEAVCYGLTDLGNAKPEHTKRSSIGFKVRAHAGSIVPIQLSCCKDCKRRFLSVEYCTMVFTAVSLLIAVLLVAIRPICEALRGVWAGLPIAVFIGVSVLGYLISRIVRRALIKKHSQYTHLNVFDLPKLAQMKEMGWFELMESKVKGYTKLVFSGKRLEQGVFTGGAPEETVEAIEEPKAEQNTEES